MQPKKQTSFTFNSRLLNPVIFGFCLGTIVFVLSHFIDSEIDVRYTKSVNTIENQGGNVDIIFLSNSYLLTGFDPLYIEAETGMNAVHLGHHGLGVIYDYANLYHTLNNFDPEYVVMDVSDPSMYPMLATTDKIKYYAKRSLVHSGVSIEKFKTLLDLRADEDFEFLCSTINPFISTLTNMKAVSFKKKSETSQEKPYYLGFEPLHSTEEKTGGGWNNFLTKFPNATPTKTKSFFEIDSLSKKYLIKSLELAKEKQVKLILISSVKSWSTTDLADLKDYVKIHDYSNVTIIDINEHKASLNMRIEDFANASHTNHTGALKQTKMFLDLLNQQFVRKPKMEPITSSLKNFHLKTFKYVADDNSGYHCHLSLKPKTSYYNNLMFNLKIHQQGQTFEHKELVNNHYITNGEIICSFDLNHAISKSRVDSITIEPYHP